MAQRLEEALIDEDLSDINDLKKKLDEDFYVIINRDIFNHFIEYRLTAKRDEIKYVMEYNLIDNKIIRLDYSLSNYDSVEHAEKLNYYFINKYLTKIKSLQELKLDINKINKLPESVGKLTNLKYLSIFDNDLSKLPDSIVNLKELEVLSLGDNNITNLPKHIGYLSNLKKLYLKNNKLKGLPDSMENLSKLISLELNNNKLKIFPKTILKLKNLNGLELNDNNIEYIPKKIYNLELLHYFYLCNNKLKKLPEEFGKLKNLKHLYLKKNKLKTIPKLLCDLIIKNSMDIMLDENRFTKIKGVEQSYTYLGDTQKYTILNSGKFYLDEIIYYFEKDIIKNVKELQVKELEEIMKNNYNKTELIKIYKENKIELAPDFYLKMINQLIAEEYDAKNNNLSISKKNNKIIEAIFDICPKLKALSGKDLGRVKNSQGFEIIK